MLLNRCLVVFKQVAGGSVERLVWGARIVSIAQSDKFYLEGVHTENFFVPEKKSFGGLRG